MTSRSTTVAAASRSPMRAGPTTAAPGTAATAATPELGHNLKRLRARRGWNLSRLAAEAGLPQSTMSKVESGQMSLNYDKLWAVASVLQVGVEELFVLADEAPVEASATGRRSIDRKAGRLGHDDHYRYRHLSVELKNRLMMPVYLEVGERPAGVPLPLTNLIGERFAYVLDGPVEFHCAHYEPVTLEAGDSLYVDAAMPHAFVSPKGVRARLVAVLTSADAEYLALCREAALRGDADASTRHRQRERAARVKR